ncbi:hypothetical protein RHMOL_Rhmol13G0148500 [Rhododendron molle]|uniref:Uncharacterized protein n=1 Tax=Rhododendron molle TaxID=49168 RepID=A0ACC0L6P2_RHOML|nr:hypothetical protein RHMOL_Rhmol13G0148500 [Rhododendron molle]
MTGQDSGVDGGGGNGLLVRGWKSFVLSEEEFGGRATASPLVLSTGAHPTVPTPTQRHPTLSFSPTGDQISGQSSPAFHSPLSTQSRSRSTTATANS